mmetsp:Transcript_2773/g.7736  ORF Transcript_2773/g.7736 Transcript_2773/m.7736 type:complete len:128 (-) Transcript_2773:1104-1487(-)
MRCKPGMSAAIHMARSMRVVSCVWGAARAGASGLHLDLPPCATWLEALTPCSKMVLLQADPAPSAATSSACGDGEQACIIRVPLLPVPFVARRGRSYASSSAAACASYDTPVSCVGRLRELRAVGAI